MRRRESHGGQIAWYERGSGAPLVMLIGTGSTMAEWDPALLFQLAGQRRLVMLDYPGVGESGPWQGPRTFGGLANEVARFMAAIGLGRADVLGWSMGGFVAQRLAIQHPDRVRRLILAGTNPGGSQAVLGTKHEQEVDSNPVAAGDPWLRSGSNFRELASVTVPTLATGGREDLVVPPANLRRIAARMPGARLRLFAGAHGFLFQQRLAFAAVVDRFLAD